jgi:hypothetical protein
MFLGMDVSTRTALLLVGPKLITDKGVRCTISALHLLCRENDREGALDRLAKIQSFQGRREILPKMTAGE